MLVGVNQHGDSLSLSKRDSLKHNVLKAFDALQGEIPNSSWKK
jgi:hypothetical protein